MKSFIVLFFVSAILIGCGEPANKKTREVSVVGKIVAVNDCTVDEKRSGPRVTTSTGLVVYFNQRTPVKIGAEATLITNNYASGMIIRELCYEKTCAELEGTTF